MRHTPAVRLMAGALALTALLACGPTQEPAAGAELETSAQAQTSSNGLVTLEAVATGKPYTFATAQVGTKLYVDRAQHAITGLSSRLQGGVLLQAANDDKQYTGTEQVRLRLNSAATVYVAMDRRNTVLPAWLADGTWSLTDETFATNDPSATTSTPSTPMKVYVKSVPGGTLVLGGGMAAPAQGTNAQYAVVAQFVTPQPGVIARYFPDIRMGGVPVLRYLPDVSFSAGTGAPVPGIPADFFGARIEGYVTPAYSQTYTFYTQASGGVRLWVNGRLLVDDWFEHGVEQHSGSIRLAQGIPASVVVEFFDAEAAASLLLRWQSPSQPLQDVPTSSLETRSLPLARPLGAHCTDDSQCRSGDCNVYPVGNVTIWNEGDAVCAPPVPEGEPGVKAEYFASEFLYTPVVARQEQYVSTFWGTTAPAPGVPAERWSARWSATLTAPSTGTYTLRTSTEDGVRLWLDGNMLMDNWLEAPGGQTLTANVSMTAGSKHDLVMEFFEGYGTAHAQLAWSGPGIPLQTITSALTTPSLFACRPLGSQCRSSEDCCGGYCSVYPVGNVTIWNEGATVCSPR
ncbi:PA14 domain-containing protein [Pyxidicoccus xibeiensis]|uniref:PA14 domain-containing protein n=1 Tax=Pyxidicoccus xibeiensis TaxID=2906759 RepID=UPI0020A7EA23|nr:PA14 domain-containing protein [Pyxidicoccus xibeiensis]MCP3140891.1 PA14 domain-containing protein [Pyxidicoccus xibeiensis]